MSGPQLNLLKLHATAKRLRLRSTPAQGVRTLMRAVLLHISVLHISVLHISVHISVGGVFIEQNQTFKSLGSKAYFCAVRHNILCICPS